MKSPRRQALYAHKRAAVLAAARRVISRHGLDGAKMREIAREADYTPGALYAYYPSKDRLLVDLAGHALGLAARRVRAGDSAADAAHQLHRYFRDNPADFDLLLSVLRSDRAEIFDGAAQRAFNGRLIAALAPIAEALIDEGLTPEEANLRAVAIAAQVLGVLMLENSGRLAALGIDGRNIIEAFSD
jgi:AcrR family transcriptional regulator